MAAFGRADRSGCRSSRSEDCRFRSLGIREIQYYVRVHGFRDPGCFHQPHDVLKLFRRKAKHAIVMLDHAWEGVPCNSSEEIEESLRRRLRTVGMSAWACPIVIEPELEAWVFSGSPQVERILGWSNRSPRLRDALEARGLWQAGDAKPQDPKTAMEWALSEVRVNRTSKIYGRLAQRVSTSNCTDRSFRRFRRLLRQWFPVTSNLH